jgi:spore maturation protein CgeB
LKLVIFGLTISSTWGNGHATLWRGLCRALHASGHDVVFFEHDVPYYSQHRDLHDPEYCRLVLYEDWHDISIRAARELVDADVALVTSYCPDSRAASRLAFDSARRTVFYDMDSPITLDRLSRGEEVGYLPEEGLGTFDLVLSYAGGAALDALRRHAGARAVAPLYGSVDPDVHRPVAPSPEHRSDLSYLGTYSPDRQHALEQLFISPARCRGDRRFALAGSQYPADFPWAANIFYLSHMPPADHPAFFCSSGLTLNITRGPMARIGYCPSGRLFEATACATTVISDSWEGLDQFFAPGHEVLIARDTGDVLAALELSVGERQRIAAAGRARTLECHTAQARARELESLLEPSGLRQMGVA